MEHGDRGSTPPFSSNAERLSMGEWWAVLLSLAFLGLLAAPTWRRVERIEADADYRVPYGSSEDYWLFDRLCRRADREDLTVVLGDSFVWGQYVGREETLSHHLNQEAGEPRFVNAGLDGAHPLALEGLTRHYCKSLRNGSVMVHLNLLWMSSPQADLRAERGARVNHPRLLPQFSGSPPGLAATVSDRIGMAVGNRLPVLALSRHIQSAYLPHGNLPRWTLDHPYESPIRPITLTPSVAEDRHQEGGAWFEEGATLQSLPWVAPDSSLQWRAFQRLVSLLQERGNRVFVLVGPLNEHMLAPESAASYGRILTRVQSWLADQELETYAPPLLPSRLYADLSHPLGPGYASLARDLLTRRPN
jgi:hypothetical protein